MNLLAAKTALALSLSVAASAATADTLIQFSAHDNPSLPTFAYDADRQGTVVGYYYAADERAYGYIRTAAGVYTDIAFPPPSSDVVVFGTYPKAVNDAGAIVGNAEVGNLNVAWVYDRASGQFQTLSMPGSNYTVVEDIMEDGTIVGWASFPDSNYVTVQRGFVLRNGTFQTIYNPLGVSTVLHGSDAAGNLLGEYYDNSRTAFTFVMHPDGSWMSPLNKIGMQFKAISDDGKLMAGICGLKACDYNLAQQRARKLTVDGMTKVQAWSIKDKTVIGFGQVNRVSTGFMLVR